MLFLFMYKNLWFSDIFRGYKKRPVNWNGLNRIVPGFLCEKTSLKIIHDRKRISKFSHIYGYSRIWVTTKVRLSLFEKILITESGARRRSSCRSSHRKCSVRKGAFRNFAKLTGKHLCQGLFFKKLLDIKFHRKKQKITHLFFRFKAWMINAASWNELKLTRLG